MCVRKCISIKSNWQELAKSDVIQDDIIITDIQPSLGDKYEDDSSLGMAVIKLA